MKLNGWQRLGLILSVAWAVGAALYQHAATYDDAQEIKQTAYALCDNSPSPTKDCHQAEQAAQLAYLDGHWWEVPLLALAPIAAAWALACLGVAVACRVIRHVVSPAATAPDEHPSGWNQPAP